MTKQTIYKFKIIVLRIYKYILIKGRKKSWTGDKHFELPFNLHCHGWFSDKQKLVYSHTSFSEMKNGNHNRNHTKQTVIHRKIYLIDREFKMKMICRQYHWHGEKLRRNATRALWVKHVDFIEGWHENRHWKWPNARLCELSELMWNSDAQGLNTHRSTHAIWIVASSETIKCIIYSTRMVIVQTNRV